MPSSMGMFSSSNKLPVINVFPSLAAVVGTFTLIVTFPVMLIGSGELSLHSAGILVGTPS